jgi:hypothetical protein
MMHKYLAVGNLSEAEDESCLDYPLLANDIRQVRLSVEEDTENGIRILTLLQRVIEMMEDDD